MFMMAVVMTRIRDWFAATERRRVDPAIHIVHDIMTFNNLIIRCTCTQSHFYDSWECV